MSRVYDNYASTEKLHAPAVSFKSPPVPTVGSRVCWACIFAIFISVLYDVGTTRFPFLSSPVSNLK
jgi:hypothetical protein